MNLSDDFTFSQSALQDYVDCPRRFELRYLRELHWPALETRQAREHEANMLRGQEFHHLLHQHAMGVPAPAIEATIEDETLRGWWRNYLRWQEAHLPARRHAELTLTIPIAETLLTAKYDVVARMPDESFLIIDWKTGRPQSRATLADRLQTIVYPYVLSLAGDWLNDGRPIPPERIRMLYWFAAEEQTVEFQYSVEKQRLDEARLTSMIGEIVNRFEFPLTSDERACRFCNYRSLCERGVEAGDLREWEEDGPDAPVSLNLDEIEEISF